MDATGKTTTIYPTKKTILFPIVSVVLIFLLVPLLFFSYLPIISILIGSLGVWMAWKEQKGYSFLFIALSFSYPYSVNLEKDILADYTWWPINVIREGILLIFIFNYVVRQIRANVITIGMVVILFFLLLLGSFYTIYNVGKYSELTNWINSGCYFFLFYYVVYNDRVSLKDFFQLLDVLFICTSFYTVMEFFFLYSPYKQIYSQIIIYDVDDIRRAKGLLGHPLVLSALVIIYQVTLYIRLMLFKRFNALLFILTLIIGVFTVSRTTTAIMVFSFLFYFIASGVYKNSKKLIATITIIVIIGFIAMNSLQSYIDDNLNRIETGSSEHRIAGYSSVISFTPDHMFGVGYTDLTKKIQKGGYASQGLIKGFGTLDNFFLTQIAAYGMFSILIFLFYFYFFKQSFCYRRKNKMLFRSALMLFCTWCLIGLSFDLEQYSCLLLLFSALYAKLNKQYSILTIERKRTSILQKNRQ